MQSNYLSYFWWFLLPKAVSWVQWFCYSVAYRAGEPKPQPGTLKFVRHYRQIFIGIVIAYILFTIYQADWELQREGNLYKLLGTPVDVEESGLRSRFRVLTRLFHPDKAVGNVEEAHNFYVLLKDARDVLSDNAKRYAYDRLGPDVLTMQAKGKTAITIYEYVNNAALSRVIPYYLGTTLVIFALNILGYFPAARFWRYFTIAAVFNFELYSLVQPQWPALLTRYINPVLMNVCRHPPLLPFELISILRTTAVSLFIGISQLQGLPSLTPPTARSAAGLSPEEANKLVHNQINYIEGLTTHLDGESQRLLEMESAPFFGLSEDEESRRDQEQTKRVLRERLKEWLVQNVVRSNPSVRDAEGRFLAKRRQGAPAGARGTK